MCLKYQDFLKTTNFLLIFNPRIKLDTTMLVDKFVLPTSAGNLGLK
jgi:hypothetical protein